MTRVAVVAGSRTPIGKAGGAYRDVHPVDLLAASMTETLRRVPVEPELIERVIVGCAHQWDAQALNIGRSGWLAAGLPYTTPALTLDAQCCSGQEVATLGAAAVASGQVEAVLVGGVESLSQVATRTIAQWENDPAFPESLLSRWSLPHQGVATERMAVKYDLNREDVDRYGVQSHQRSDAAWTNGALDAEVALVMGPEGALLQRDEGIRPDSSMESAARLKPAFDPEGITTAANSSQLSDGSATLMLASEDFCDRHGLQPMAWITHTAVTGTDPTYMLEGPISSTERVLERAGRKLDEMDHIEIHEAFAVPVVAWLRYFGLEQEAVNPHGGAIGMGHPFGASGTRQLVHLAHVLQQTGGLGLQTMCGGGGLGAATILESA